MSLEGRISAASGVAMESEDDEVDARSCMPCVEQLQW